MAISAVSEALSKFNEILSSSSCGAHEEQYEELVTELTWMQSFLVDGEKTPQGQARTEVWSSAIQRLAVCAQGLQSGGDNKGVKSREIAYLNKRLVSLREKIQPFISCQVQLEKPEKIPDSVPVPTAQIPKELKVGAWGGSGGGKWDFKPKGMIKHISIVQGKIIESIAFTSINTDGKLETPVLFGESNCTTTIEVDIKSPSEYLTGISGTFGLIDGVSTVITSLKLHTNMCVHGPYGLVEGTPFSFVVEDGKIVGFHGNSGKYIDAIGVYATSV